MRLFSKWKDRYIKEPIAEQAVDFIEKGQYNLAIRVLEEGLELDPDYPSFLWLRADVALKIEDFESALACYEDLEEVLGDETPAALYEARGNVYYNQKAYEDAILAFMQAERKGLAETNLFFKRGISLLQVRNYDLALRDFLKVEKDNPDFPDLGPFLAETYFFLKKYRTATAYFRRAGQKYDLTEKQFSMLADSYLKMKAYKKASIIYSTLLHKFPEQARYLNKRAYCYTYLGKTVQAIHDLNKALILEPDYAAAFCNRGYAKLLEGNHEGGKSDIDMAISLNPANGWGHRNLAYFYILKNQPEIALRQLERAFIMNGEIPLLYYFKGLALLQMEESQEAIKALQIAGKRGEHFAMQKLKELGE